MNMITMTADSLSKQVGETVPEIYVIIAKNAVVGLEPSIIADLLGATREEVEEVQATQVYKDVRLLLSSEYARGRVEADFSWDGIEQTALKNLTKHMAREQDPEFNLKVAVLANKAQRRFASGPAVLDPSTAAAKVPLNLTSRIVKRLNMRTGEATVEETRSISVMDGSAVNPNFEDIDKMFGVSARPAIATQATQRVTDSDFSVDDLAEAFITGKTR